MANKIFADFSLNFLIIQFSQTHFEIPWLFPDCCTPCSVSWNKSIFKLIQKLMNICHPKTCATYVKKYAHNSCYTEFVWGYPYHSGLFHWHWGNQTMAPVPVKWSSRICQRKNTQQTIDTCYIINLKKKSNINVHIFMGYTDYQWFSARLWYLFLIYGRYCSLTLNQHISWYLTSRAP